MRPEMQKQQTAANISCGESFKDLRDLCESNILGDPGADSGGKGKTKRAEKNLYFSSRQIFLPV